MNNLDFKNWILQEAFGSFKYQFPSDKKQQMADFYALQMLLGRDSFDLKRQKIIADKGEDSYQFGKPRSMDDQPDKEGQLDYVIGEIRDQMLPQLKKEILEDVLYSIAAEFRHVKDDNTSKEILKLAQKLGPEYEYITKKYFRYFMATGSHDGFLRRVNNDKEKHHNISSSYLNAYKAYLISKATPEQFVNLAKLFFEEASWTTGYGGENWANICKAWMDLNKAKSIQSMFVQIDHIYDIQHNNGSVFDKLASYQNKQGSHNWIANFLDKKANMNNPLEIYQEVSPSMKKILPMAAKFKFGTSLEDFGTIEKPRHLANATSVSDDNLEKAIKSQWKSLKDWCNTITSIEIKALSIFSFIKEYQKLPYERKKTLIYSAFYSEYSALGYHEKDFNFQVDQISHVLNEIDDSFYNLIQYWDDLTVSLSEEEDIKEIKKQVNEFLTLKDKNFNFENNLGLNENFYNRVYLELSESEDTSSAVIFVKNTLNLPIVSARCFTTYLHRIAHLEGKCNCLEKLKKTNSFQQSSEMDLLKKIWMNHWFISFNPSDTLHRFARMLMVFRAKIGNSYTIDEESLFNSLIKSLYLNPIWFSYKKVIKIIEEEEFLLKNKKLIPFNLGFYQNVINLYSDAAISQSASAISLKSQVQQLAVKLSKYVLGLNIQDCFDLIINAHAEMHKGISNTTGFDCYCNQTKSKNKTNQGL